MHQLASYMHTALLIYTPSYFSLLFSMAIPHYTRSSKRKFRKLLEHEIGRMTFLSPKQEHCRLPKLLST